MNDIKTLLQATLHKQHGPDATITAIDQRAGAQGYSGAAIHYYHVSYIQDGKEQQTTLLTKQAALNERKTLTWLTDQAVAVPLSYTLDLTSDNDAPICIAYVGEEQPKPAVVATALAKIHASGMGKTKQLPWLPKANQSFIADWLIHRCWREVWQMLLAGQSSYYGVGGAFWGPIKPGADFRATFAAYTEPLEAAAEQLLTTIGELWASGNSLTLIHADLHNNHVRFANNRAYLIDWGFAHYGPLYLDLPNYFTRTQALLYRNALADLGHSIPEAQFIRYYDIARAYPGLKYFTIGLWNWCYGDPPHQKENVMHFMNMVLK